MACFIASAVIDAIAPGGQGSDTVDPAAWYGY